MDTLANEILNRLGEGGRQGEGDDFRWLPGGACRTIHSDNRFERMGTRVSLQAIGDYIRDKGDATTFYQKPFQERMDEADRELDKKLRALIQDRKTAAEIQSAVSAYEGTAIDVYFALGMKAGARLNAMLMGGFDKDY